MFTVYVLYSTDHHKIYIGFTSNLPARIAAHHADKGKGYTHAFRAWKLVYTETFSQKSEARIREKQLKSAQGRNFIWNLVEGLPPR